MAWIFQDQELASDTEIHEFCKKFLQLFGSNFSTEVAQKSTALRLFGLHQGRKLKKGIDLPAEELELFELAWDEEARARCRRCKGPCPDKLASPFHVTPPLCNTPCGAPAEMKLACRKCSTPTVMKDGWATCSPCGRLAVKPPRSLPSFLGLSLKRGHNTLRITNNIWFNKLTPDADGAPPAKRKRA